MNTPSEQKQKHNQRIADYRAKSGKERLELMVPSPLAERFRNLSGFEGQTHAQKLEALCELWEQRVIPVSNQPGSLTDTGIAKLDTGITSEQSLDLDRVIGELDSFSQELAREDAQDAAPEKARAQTRAAVQKPKPAFQLSKGRASPPADEDEYRQAMVAALHKLYDRLYPKTGKPGNNASARLRKNLPIVSDLRNTPYHKLYQLLVADLLPVTESELRTLASLSDSEKRLALWTLVHGRQ